MLRFLLMPLQAAPPTDPAAILTAIEGHQWTVIAATGIYIVAMLMKQGWLGMWLQDHLPKRALPFLAPLAGILVLTSGELYAGKPWGQALLDGLLAGILPIVMHETIVESARGGKELIKAKTPPVPPGPSLTTGPGPTITMKSEPPKPPGIQRRAFVQWTGRGSLLLLAGCATNWWQQFQENPTATIGALASYVNAFLATAQTIWNQLSPLLGADTPKANAIFNNAMVTAEKTLTELQDAVQIAVIAQTKNPDFSALVKALQDAIANVFAVITQWQQPAGVKGAAEYADAMATLTHQAQVIAKWRTP